MDSNIKKFSISSYILKEGYNRGFLFDSGEIKISEGTSEGFFITSKLNSSEDGTKWGRLVLKSEQLHKCDFCVYILASDHDNFLYKNELISYDKFFKSADISEEEKIYILSNGAHSKVVYNAKDILLLGLEGKYLWFGFQIKYVSENVKIDDINVYFPGDSLIKYFPEIYKKNKNDFFERYLSIFSSLNKDYQRKVDDACNLLDVDETTDEALYLIAGWLGLNIDGKFLNSDQLRVLVKNSKYINQYKGTLDVIAKVVELFVGERPFIVEQFKVQKYMNNDNIVLYQNLYGSNRFEFFIILNKELSKEVFYQLKSLINLFKPARTKSTILFLRQHCQADSYCYIDINSRLMSNAAGVLDIEQCLDTNIILT